MLSKESEVKNVISINILFLFPPESNEFLHCLRLENAINLKTAHNIASHDYDRMKFTILYIRCLQLISEKAYNELSNLLEVINNGSQTN